MAGNDFFLMRWAKLYSKPTEAETALEPAIASLGTPYRFQHPFPLNSGWRRFPEKSLPRRLHRLSAPGD